MKKACSMPDSEEDEDESDDDDCEMMSAPKM